MFISIFKKFNQVFSTKLSLRTYIRIKLKNKENYEEKKHPWRIRYDIGNYIQGSRDQLLAWADFISNSKYLNALFNSLVLFLIHVSVLMFMLIAKDLFSLYYFAFSPFIIFFSAKICVGEFSKPANSTSKPFSYLININLIVFHSCLKCHFLFGYM